MFRPEEHREDQVEPDHTSAGKIKKKKKKEEIPGAFTRLWPFLACSLKRNAAGGQNLAPAAGKKPESRVMKRAKIEEGNAGR